MTAERATEILRCMANGVDPITGEILEEGHLCNSPEVIRALCAAIHAMTKADGADTSYPVRKNGKLNAGRPWTDDDLDALKRMHRDGASMDSICMILHRRERGVLKQMRLLGLKQKKASASGLERAGERWTKEEDDLLKDLHIDRWPIEEIAAKMQRSEYAIYCRMEKLQLYGAAYGYPPKEEYPPWNNKDNQQLREMFLSGIPVDELATHFEQSENSIRARLFYLGLTRESPLPPWRKRS